MLALFTIMMISIPILTQPILLKPLSTLLSVLVTDNGMALATAGVNYQKLFKICSKLVFYIYVSYDFLQSIPSCLLFLCAEIFFGELESIYIFIIPNGLLFFI